MNDFPQKAEGTEEGWHIFSLLLQVPDSRLIEVGG